MILNRFSFFLILLIPFGRLVAQNSFPCDSVTATIDQFQTRIDRINYTDPELITLHYLFVIDLENEINSFYQNRIYKLDQCPGGDAILLFKPLIKSDLSSAAFHRY